MWYFEMISSEYGPEKFGGYDTKIEAIAGMVRILENALELNDGVERDYIDPYFVQEP